MTSIRLTRKMFKRKFGFTVIMKISPRGDKMRKRVREHVTELMRKKLQKDTCTLIRIAEE